MVDTNDELLLDHWELTPASQAMALLIIILCEHVTSPISSNRGQFKHSSCIQVKDIICTMYSVCKKKIDYYKARLKVIVDSRPEYLTFSRGGP